MISSGYPRLTSSVSVRNLNKQLVGFSESYYLDIPSHHSEGADNDWEKTIDIVDTSRFICEGPYVVSVWSSTDEIIGNECEAKTTSLGA